MDVQNHKKPKRVKFGYPAARPESGFLRLTQIIGDPDSVPPTPALFPVSRSAWWAGVKSGKYPKPVKLGANTTAWRAQDVKALLEKHGAAHEAA